MFKKTMKFDDLDGNEVTQTFYFNYNKKEIAELLEFKQLEEKLKLLSTPVEESGLSQIENNQQAYDIFQDLILDAYGEKGVDNVTFVKNERLREYFKSHVAFVELIFEFLEKPALAAEFIENCLPAKLVAKAKAEMTDEQKAQYERNLSIDTAGKTSSADISALVQEADRRQQDPATRVEPSATATVVDEPKATATEKKMEDLTAEDVFGMDEVSFKKLDPRRLSQPAMMAAFNRKSNS